MIRSRAELKFYIMADRMMNRGKFKWSLKDRIKHLLLPDYVMRYLKSMRYVAYVYDYKWFTSRHYLCGLMILGIYYYYRFRKLGTKLGFSIGSKVFGYGLVIPHYGTIVVGGSNRIGNYAVLHTSTCISGNGKVIGDALYLSTGAKITSKIRLGDNVSIGANSLVNKSFESNIMIAGCPAKIIKNVDAWYVRDGEFYARKVQLVEELKSRMNI